MSGAKELPSQLRIHHCLHGDISGMKSPVWGEGASWWLHSELQRVPPGTAVMKGRLGDGRRSRRMEILKNKVRRTSVLRHAKALTGCDQ